MSKKNAYPNYDADVAVKQPKRKKKGSGLLGRIIRRFFLVLFTIIILIVVALCLVLNTIFQGPSDAAREVLTMSLLEPSGTKWIPPLFLDKATLDAIRYGDQGLLDIIPPDVGGPGVTVIPGGSSENVDEWKDYPDGVYIKEVKGATFNAYVMVIRDPSQVYMATSSVPFSKNQPGLRINQAIKKEGAIAAINAGAFFDNGTSDPVVGSVPEGLVIAGGEVLWTSGQAPENGFAGFNEDNVLVVDHTMTAKRAKELKIRDGCCFGPVLLMNGVVNDTEFSANSGYNPRTAIGQRADGSVIFLCIDGRQASSLGGTYADLIDIMVEYGAVNACNLDGGSSTVMLYRDHETGKVSMINNYSLLQKEPRRMPNFFMVRPESED